MELKYKLAIWFWKVFPWIMVLLGFLVIIAFIYSMVYVLSYVDKYGLKSIVERIWNSFE